MFPLLWKIRFKDSFLELVENSKTEIQRKTQLD